MRIKGIDHFEREENEKTNKKIFSDYYKDEEVVNSYDEIRLKTKYRRDKRKKEMQIFMELINPQESDKILELGCSSGFMTQFLKGNITALDTSENMLKIAGQKNPNADFICMDMFDINRRFKEEFNKVTSKRVLTHLTNEELEDLFYRVNKVLVNKGEFIFDVEGKSLLRRVVRPFYGMIFKVTGVHTYQVSLIKLSDMLSKCGFNLINVKYLKHKVGYQMMIKARKRGKEEWIGKLKEQSN